MQAYTHECSFCKTKHTSEGGSVKDSWEGVKALGWRAYREGEEWKRKCPSCVRSLSNRSGGSGAVVSKAPSVGEGSVQGEMFEIVKLLAELGPPIDTGAFEGDVCCFCGEGKEFVKHAAGCVWKRAVVLMGRKDK